MDQVGSRRLLNAVTENTGKEYSWLGRYLKVLERAIPNVVNVAISNVIIPNVVLSIRVPYYSLQKLVHLPVFCNDVEQFFVQL